MSARPWGWTGRAKERERRAGTGRAAAWGHRLWSWPSWTSSSTASWTSSAAAWSAHRPAQGCHGARHLAHQGYVRVHGGSRRLRRAHCCLMQRRAKAACDSRAAPTGEDLWRKVRRKAATHCGTQEHCREGKVKALMTNSKKGSEQARGLGPHPCQHGPEEEVSGWRTQTEERHGWDLAAWDGPRGQRLGVPTPKSGRYRPDPSAKQAQPRFLGSQSR